MRRGWMRCAAIVAFGPWCPLARRLSLWLPPLVLAAWGLGAGQRGRPASSSPVEALGKALGRTGCG